ncbi:MAG TPA: aromatic-ring-hydroxylating dioxygenase subunit beta [Rhodoblastus sp.]|nr:aromatic-ring-hydroxylating dioxygenase subunit beta [Rhodoblastus sp.]
MIAARTDADLMRDVEQFLFHEARLADEHRYEEWEDLWTDDAVYWAPANGDDIDPEQQMSIIYDNRSRIGVRVRQLLSGKRYTQDPRSGLRRIIGNIEFLGREGDDIRVGANSIVFESSQRGETIWGSRNEYTLRRAGDGFKLVRKKVSLVNNDRAIYTMSFII